MSEYICKVASIDEMNNKWDYEILKATTDKENWIIWKKRAVENVIGGKSISYYGKLDQIIICEATAIFDSSEVQNAENLVDEETAYLTAFRTIDEYQGQGYFSQLFKFMIEDLKRRGYKKVTLGVEPEEEKNKLIYAKYGFNEHIKDAIKTYPDGTKINVEYYGKEF